MSFKNINCSKDLVAIFFSVLCGVHCLLTPLILLMPFVQERFSIFDHHAHESIHIILFVVIFPLALSVLYNAFKEKLNLLMIVSILGLLLLCLSTLNNFSHFFEHESVAEVSLALTASFFLIWAHIKNLSLKACK